MERAGHVPGLDVGQSLNLRGWKVFRKGGGFESQEVGGRNV